MERTGPGDACHHDSVDVDFEGADFGKPVTGICQRCKQRVPAAVEVVL